MVCYCIQGRECYSNCRLDQYKLATRRDIYGIKRYTGRLERTRASEHRMTWIWNDVYCVWKSSTRSHNSYERQGRQSASDQDSRAVAKRSRVTNRLPRIFTNKKRRWENVSVDKRHDRDVTKSQDLLHSNPSTTRDRTALTGSYIYRKGRMGRESISTWVP